MIDESKVECLDGATKVLATMRTREGQTRLVEGYRVGSVIVRRAQAGDMLTGPDGMYRPAVGSWYVQSLVSAFVIQAPDEEWAWFLADEIAVMFAGCDTAEKEQSIIRSRAWSGWFNGMGRTMTKVKFRHWLDSRRRQDANGEAKHEKMPAEP